MCVDVAKIVINKFFRSLSPEEYLDVPCGIKKERIKELVKQGPARVVIKFDETDIKNALGEVKKKDDEGNSFLEPWGDVDIFEIDKSTTGRAYWKDVFGKLCSPCLQFVEKSLDVTPELRSCIAAGVAWLEQEVVVLEQVVVAQKEKYTAQREKYSKKRADSEKLHRQQAHQSMWKSNIASMDVGIRDLISTQAPARVHRIEKTRGRARSRTREEVP